MRHPLVRHLLAVVLALMPVCAVHAGESYSRTMSGWFNVTTPDGWTGRRYMDGPNVFAEEFDSNGDGRIDVWRFYRRGLLSSEERDTNAVGRVNFQSKWEAREGRLLSVLRDTRSRGVNDLEIEYVARRRWEIREDRNLDGVTDRILIVNGPPELFEALGMDLAAQANVIDNVPVEYWHELWSDDTYTTVITDYRRFSGGVISHYGEWDGGKVAWRRVTSDYVPPPPPAPQFAAATGHLAGCVDSACQGGSFCRVEPSDAPITDVREDPGYYAGGVHAEPPATGYAGAAGGSFRDRTRYDDMPPGDSAARSVPARMRPPGTNRR